MKDKTKQRISELISEGIRDGITAGISILVRKDDKEEYFDAQGYADREHNRAVSRDTIFKLYSMSKPITATAAMILMEQGKLDLAQEVSEFLPGFSNLTVEKDGKTEQARMPMTVQDLLNMTSGLTYGDENTAGGREILAYLEECVGKMYTDQAVSTQEFANHIGTIPLAFEPSASWNYGLSADVMGAVIEVASGMRFGEFLEENLFQPLGMRDTGFWVPEEKQNRLAVAYESIKDGKVQPYTGDHIVIQHKMQKRPAFESGGAGLVSTIDDYSRFAQMLLNGGNLDGIRILSPETVRFLTSGGLTPSQQEAMWKWPGLSGHTYSHFMRILTKPEMACMLGRKGEYGWDGWLGCYFANFPTEKMIILIMMQKKDSGTIPLTRKIRNVLLAEMEDL